MAKALGGLGKGFDALFGDVLQEENNENKVQLLPLRDIDPNPGQPRKIFEPHELDALAESIRSVGIIQPIVVVPNGKRYSIVAGERRWRAARLAELSEIPCIVRELEDVQRMEMALIENIQRTDLNAIETAKAIEGLMQQCGLTQEQVSRRIGKSRPAVANLLRLLSLPKDVSELVEVGAISEGHARAILGAGDEKQMSALAQMVVAKGLNVRQTEALAKGIKEKRESPEREEESRCAELELVEEAARKRFGVKVSIIGNERSGKLVLHYNTAEELERIYDVLRLEE